MTAIRTVAELEQVVGSRPLGALMKSVRTLDEHCVRLLALSPFAVVGFAAADGRARATIAGGAPGFARVLDPTHLRIELDEAATVDPSVGCALLFFIPGLGETLRVNGRATIEGATLTVTVEEAFAHCAKALLRSSFWSLQEQSTQAGALEGEASGVLAEPHVREKLGRTPFVALVSWDAQGRADASPKGDPPSFLRIWDGKLAVPDRPGNRRTDTFHNVLEQPRVALLALAPGDDWILEVSGVASLTVEPSLLASMAVQGKTPKIALLLEAQDADLRRSQALAKAVPWDPARSVPREELPDMAGVFVDHVKQNDRRGVAASAIRALLSKGMMRRALAHDYEKNRY
ncbi:MAG TPA: pyridoxamine 5'-phosphate oxidase family protein [Candidatus Binatia bacterium]